MGKVKIKKEYLKWLTRGALVAIALVAGSFTHVEPIIADFYDTPDGYGDPSTFNGGFYDYPTPPDVYDYPTPVYDYPTPAYDYPDPLPDLYPTPSVDTYQSPYDTPYDYPTPAYAYPTPAYPYPTPYATPYATPSYPYPTPSYPTPYAYPTPASAPVWIAADPQFVHSGGSTSLSWGSTSMFSCTVKLNGVTIYTGTSGVKTITNITQPRVYTVRCQNLFGVATSRSVKISLVPTWREI